MKYVHIAYGKTYNHSYELRRCKFHFHRGDKVWIKFWDTEDPLKIKKVEQFVLSLRDVGYDSAPATPYLQTSVDPFAPTEFDDPPTGYKSPEIRSSRQVFEYNNGDCIELKGWLAKKLKRELNLDIFFRNIEITEVANETYKAIQCKFKFISKISCNCHFCGKALDTEISRATGVGPICLQKVGIKRATVENAKEILERLDELAKEIGELGPLWIAKSQIQQRLEFDNEEKQQTEQTKHTCAHEGCNNSAEKEYDCCSDECNAKDWIDQKNKFADLEREQEYKAFMAKILREGA